MKAIVFGGSGFIGSHVADELSNRGYKVTVFVLNFSSYLRQDQKMVVGDILDLKRGEESSYAETDLYHSIQARFSFEI